MKYPMDKYKFYKRGNDVIAVSTYAGKTVKAYAKCDPRDAYDERAGQTLAAARCNAKIADKREARARKKVLEAQAQLEAARQHYEKMSQYLRDSQHEASIARMEVESIEQTM